MKGQITPLARGVCVCVHPDSKLRVLARHVLCAVVEAGASSTTMTTTTLRIDQHERTDLPSCEGCVCVCVDPDSKLRVLARHVLCAVVEAGGHPYHLSWMPNEEGSG